MAPRFCKIVIFQFVIFKVFTSAQPSIKQYLHVTGVGPHSQSAGLTSLPTVGVSPRQVVPTTGLSSLSALGLPGLISTLQQSSVDTKTLAASPGLPVLKNQPASHIPNLPACKNNSPPTNTQNGGLDSSVLNNLAIALQLLIVSNILNSTPDNSDNNPIYEMLEIAKNIPLPGNSEKNSFVSYAPAENTNFYPVQAENFEQMYLPNANFVGTPSFTDMSVKDPFTKGQNTRNSFQLMSPYEALLGPNCPYSDPILSSPFGSVISSKKDFQSPYAMMNDDVFAMSDVF